MAKRMRIEDIRFVCEHPGCPIGTGSYGRTTEDVLAEIIAAANKVPKREDPPPPETPPKPPPGDAVIPPELAALDPDDAGVPCPTCVAADPPRDGTLLAVPTDGEYAGMLAAAAGWQGLAMWQLVRSGKTGTLRLLDALAAIDDGKPKVKPKGFVVGKAPITMVVVRVLPFDGHLLQFGNRDAWVNRSGKGSKFVAAEPRYGVATALAAVGRETPAYVRELQEDLLWLGYFSPSRGSPAVGEFDSNLLGAVLAFKQDLVDPDIYGIAMSDKRELVPPGSVVPGKFDTPIHYQAKFISPVRMILDWGDALADDGGLLRKLQLIARKLGSKSLKKAKTAAAFTKVMDAVETLIREALWWVDHWPHGAAFEDITEPFLPFAPRPATKAIGELVAPATSPKHADAKALAGDPVWGRGDMGARGKNASAFATERKGVLSSIAAAHKSLADCAANVAAASAPVGGEADLAGVAASIGVLVARATTLLGLVRWWVLDSPTQVEAWLEHLREMGTVDMPTAVYLKALREGGAIGPNQRIAYQMFVDPPDFPSGDAGGQYIRDKCIARPANREGRNATTMPESLALQFFFNESGGRFGRTAAPFAVDIKGNRRLPLLGTDTNSYRRGSFDGVFHKGDAEGSDGTWYTSRGWGIGQATEATARIDGVQLIRGLPIMDPGVKEIRHPRSFTDPHASFDEAFEGKAIAKFNRTEKRDCSYGRSEGGHHYDCQECLGRFFKLGLAGSKKEKGEGGVIVPTSKGAFGKLHGATGFFIDLERYTAFARANGGVEDPTRAADYERLFGAAVEPAPAHVIAVLRAGPSIAAAADDVAEDLGLDPETVAADVHRHIERRRDLPCSWMRVRLLYAGSGPQAFESIYDMLEVVGAGEGKPVVTKHIAEASALRRFAGGGGG
jgi:hypothetical protein